MNVQQTVKRLAAPPRGRILAAGCVVALLLLPACRQFDRRSLSDHAQPPTARVADSTVADSTVADSAADSPATTAAVSAKQGVQRIDHQQPNIPIAKTNGSKQVVPATAQNQVTVLNLADVERMAREHNPTLAQAQANVGSADGRWVQAGLYPNPQIGYQGNEIGNNGAAGQQGVFLSQEIVTANKLGLSQHAAAHEVGRREAQWAAQEYRVLTSVRIAFYNALVAQESVNVAQKLVDVAKQGVTTTKSLKQAQKASDVEVLQAQVEFNQANILLTKARNRKQAAWKELRTVIGNTDIAETTLTGEWRPTIVDADRDTLLQQILSQSPEITVAQQNVSRAQAALARAQVQPIPNVTVQGGLQYDYSTRDPVVNLQLSLPIPVRNRNQGNISAAHSDWIAASRELERRQLAIRNRFATAYERYANARYEVEQYRTAIIPDASKSLELVKSVFDKGETTYLRLLTAQRSNFQARVSYLNAVREWWSAKLEIDGLLLKDGLQDPDQ